MHVDSYSTLGAEKLPPMAAYAHAELARNSPFASCTWWWPEPFLPLQWAVFDRPSQRLLQAHW